MILLKKKVRALLGQGTGVSSEYVHPFNYTNASYFLYLERMLNIVEGIPGDVVECGVGRGRSLLLFGFLVKDRKSVRKIWGFDSFSGFPEPVKEDTSAMRVTKKGDKNLHTIATVLAFFASAGLGQDFIRSQMTLIKGYFSESLSKYRGDGIALLHLDGDLYESYKDPLRELYPKVVKGGVILFDEYLNTTEHAKFPGAQKAIDEFFGDRVQKISRDVGTGKYYFIKE